MGRPRWAIITTYGSAAEEVAVPAGCRVEAYSAHGTPAERTNWWAIRCEDTAALTRLRQQQDDWPFDHGSAGDDPETGCGGVKSVTASYRNFTTRWHCSACGESWAWGWDEWSTGVDVVASRRDAIDGINERADLAFLGVGVRATV